MNEKTAGELVNAARSAHPGVVHWRGWELRYLGEITLPTPPDGLFVPFPDVGKTPGECDESAGGIQ